MTHLKIYNICPNGLSRIIVSLQGCSICNLLHLLKINEVVEPIHVGSAIFLALDILFISLNISLAKVLKIIYQPLRD